DDGVVGRAARRLDLVHDGVGVENDGPSLGQHPRHRRLARPDAPGEPDDQHGPRNVPADPSRGRPRPRRGGRFASPLAAEMSRTFVPLRYDQTTRLRAVGLLAETGVAIVAVVATGYWDSPFVFCLLTPVIAAGFAAGFTFAIATAAAVSIAVGVPAVADGGTD